MKAIFFGNVKIFLEREREREGEVKSACKRQAQKYMLKSMYVYIVLKRKL
jgi:hypothetical protein